MRRLALAAILAAVPAAAQEPRPVQREIAGASGRTAVVLDADVYEHAREDLGDLRVVDAGGAAAPYLIERAARAEPLAEPRRPDIRNRAFVRGQSATATLDFGGPVPKDALTLRLPGDNFRRRVMVEARGLRDAEWMTLVDDAWVFAVPEPSAARYETVPLPLNNEPLLRVTVFNGEGDVDRLSIDDAWIAPAPPQHPSGTWRAVPVIRSEDGTRHETVVVLDLGARHQPYLGLRLHASSARFFRGVVLEQAGPPGRDERNAWSVVRDDVIYRMPPVDARPMVAAIAGDRAAAASSPTAHDKLTIAASGRARRLRLRILNRDDAPLELSAFEAEVPQERVVFEAQPGRTYALAYGRPELPPPSYDLERTVGDAGAWGATASVGALRAPVVQATPAPPAKPWTEQHPALLWTGLVIVVGALGLVTWRALAHAG